MLSQTYQEKPNMRR